MEIGTRQWDLAAPGWILTSTAPASGALTLTTTRAFDPASGGQRSGSSYPGCDLTRESLQGLQRWHELQGKFDNHAAFGGHPEVPAANPLTGEASKNLEEVKSEHLFVTSPAVAADTVQRECLRARTGRWVSCQHSPRRSISKRASFRRTSRSPAGRISRGRFSKESQIEPWVANGRPEFAAAPLEVDPARGLYSAGFQISHCLNHVGVALPSRALLVTVSKGPGVVISSISDATRISRLVAAGRLGRVQPRVEANLPAEDPRRPIWTMANYPRIKSHPGPVGR